jgi:hypothetical protein
VRRRAGTPSQLSGFGHCVDGLFVLIAQIELRFDPHPDVINLHLSDAQLPAFDGRIKRMVIKHRGLIAGVQVVVCFFREEVAFFGDVRIGCGGKQDQVAADAAIRLVRKCFHFPAEENLNFIQVWHL